MQQLYEYAVIKQETRNKDGKITEAGEIIVTPTYILSDSEDQVEMIAARAIPEEHMSDLERITLVVRPF